MIVHQQAVQAYEPSPSFTGCSCCLKFKKGGVVWLHIHVQVYIAHDSHVIEIQIQNSSCVQQSCLDRPLVSKLMDGKLPYNFSCLYIKVS